jgi:lipoprotein-anchoring transpeptidase ErfK/SrfK
MQGALMAFETDHGMVADGVAGPTVWRALINAVLAGHRSTFGYTFVSVSEESETLNLWHSGKTVLTTPVNTGIASAPTATGTYPVYEHLPVTTMSGTNPDGSHYSDPGIPDVSYFNGGDALHGFTRAQYGFPQSLGCVEMPYSTAAAVYPYTPIGTLVNVT